MSRRFGFRNFAFPDRQPTFRSCWSERRWECLLGHLIEARVEITLLGRSGTGFLFLVERSGTVSGP